MNQNQPPDTMCKELLAVAKKYPRIVQAWEQGRAYCKGALVSDGGDQLYISRLHSNKSPLEPTRTPASGRAWVAIGTFQ